MVIIGFIITWVPVIFCVFSTVSLSLVFFYMLFVSNFLVPFMVYFLFGVYLIYLLGFFHIYLLGFWYTALINIILMFFLGYNPGDDLFSSLLLFNCFFNLLMVVFGVIFYYGCPAWVFLVMWWIFFLSAGSIFRSYNEICSHGLWVTVVI